MVTGATNYDILGRIVTLGFMHAGDVFSASRALSPDRFELSMFETVYINVVMFVLSFSAAAVIINCVVSILIDVYWCAEQSFNVLLHARE